MLQHTPEAFHSDVGHIWDLVVRKSGVELTSSIQMVNGRAGILHFKPPVFGKEENWKVKVVERKPFTTTEMKEPLN